MATQKMFAIKKQGVYKTPAYKMLLESYLQQSLNKNKKRK